METGSESAMENPTLEGWTKVEKFNLLQGLKECGSSDAEALTEFVPTKTISDIMLALDYYKSRMPTEEEASDQWKTRKQKRRALLSGAVHPPLTEWASLLLRHSSFRDLKTETAAALNLIAEFENFPNPMYTHGFNIRLLYHTLADVVQGKPIPHDKFIYAAFSSAILETALRSKALIKPLDLNWFLDSLDISSEGQITFLRPSSDHELNTLRHLAGLRNYNPLDVPERMLKPQFF